ncbi:MAG: DJ-1/PfpI/YhbO family deglycase/protease [Acidobacteriia bacterium]|nr:DJ-1/PfpI/YhbO family deglycase/protease [Terriglobia bacterium]
MDTKKLSGKRVLMVIAPDQFRDEELLVPRQMLELEGARVDVASRSKMECQGMLGVKVRPDLLISEARAVDYDAIIVVGGMGSPQYLWGDSVLHALIRELYTVQKPTAAICLSGAVLARAGVLKGRRATVYKTPESIKEFEKAGATYTGEAVTQDGNVITGENPEAARKFGEALIEKLAAISASRKATA